jgi:hypothetical protein
MFSARSLGCLLVAQSGRPDRTGPWGKADVCRCTTRPLPQELRTGKTKEMNTSRFALREVPGGLYGCVIIGARPEYHPGPLLSSYPGALVGITHKGPSAKLRLI